MRIVAIGLLAAAGFAASVPTLAPAAELSDRTEVCAQGTVWDGYRCVRRAPRPYAPRAYVAPPVVEEEVVVAPPVYVEPVYAPPVVGFYAGPRYVWGGPRYYGYGYGYRWAGPRYAWAGPRYAWAGPRNNWGNRGDRDRANQRGRR